MTRNCCIPACLATVVLLFGAVRAGAQTAPADPLVVRLNGTQVLTEVMLPLTAASVPQLHQSFARIDVRKYEMMAPAINIGVAVESWLSDVRFDLPVDSNDVIARFRSATAPLGRLLLDYDFDGAKLSFKIHVRTRATSDLSKLALSITQQRMLSLEEVFTVSVSRLSGSIDLRLERSGNAVRIDTVNAATARIGSVQVSDSAWLTEIADFVLGFDKLFNVVDSSNLNDALTQLTNNVLAGQVNLKSVLRKHASTALDQLANQQFPQQTLALPQLGLLLYQASLAEFATTSGAAGSRGTALMAWNVVVEGRPDNAAPDLKYTRYPRRGEYPAQVAEQGHAQLLVPWTFLDHVAFEVVQAGALRSIAVPDPDGTGPLRAFVMHVVPTAVPRVQPDPADRSRVVISFAARMDDAVIGSVTPSAPSGGYPTLDRPQLDADIDISAVAANAGVQLYARLGANSGSVWMSVERVSLNNLSGQVRFGAASASLAPYRPLLENAINARLAPPGLGRIPLTPRVMPLMPSLGLRLGTPVPGLQYLQLPLSVVRTLQPQDLLRVN